MGPATFLSVCIHTFLPFSSEVLYPCHPLIPLNKQACHIDGHFTPIIQSYDSSVVLQAL